MVIWMVTLDAPKSESYASSHEGGKKSDTAGAEESEHKSMWWSDVVMVCCIA